MPGFYGSWEKNNSISTCYDMDTANTEIYSNSNIDICRATITKFHNDKVFGVVGSWYIVLEGSILNKTELYQKYNVTNMYDLCFNLTKIHEDQFFTQLRGTFSGLIQNISKNTLTLFTDHVGDKQVYYSKRYGIFGTSIYGLISIMKQNKLDITINIKNAYSLLSLGYLLDNNTLISDIEKLHAGTYVRVINGKVSIHRYHSFTNNENKKDAIVLNEAIENLDYLFKRAVQNQIKKNEEYGYDNVAPLSAGLDSRVTVFALNELTSESVLNITYSQSNYYDEYTAKQIANDIGNNWLFKSLDNGVSLKYLDESTMITGSQILYYGPGQVLDIVRLLEKDNIGIIHTGMLGDSIVNAGFLTEPCHTKPEYRYATYSSKLLNKYHLITGEKYLSRYENQEIFNLYNRGFNGANMGSPLVFQEFTESFSPFYDVDVIEFCLSLPISIRWDNKLYYEWIKSRYLEASRYPHNGNKVFKKNIVKIKYNNRLYTLSDFSTRATQKLKSIFSDTADNVQSMNPLTKWYKNISDIRIFMDDYFKNHINLIKDDELRQDCTNLYLQGNGIEKTQVLSLLSLCKLIS